MAQFGREDVHGGLYERLLHRLAIALDEADSDTRLRNTTPEDLELRGLSPAELELIRAYLDRDLHWLRGWHAAAKEMALIEQSPATTVKPPRFLQSAKVVKPKGQMKRRNKLQCALCGTPAIWRPGEGVQACSACGSQLFRAAKPR